jgi:hypothetical protein
MDYIKPEPAYIWQLPDENVTAAQYKKWQRGTFIKPGKKTELRD